MRCVKVPLIDWVGAHHVFPHLCSGLFGRYSRRPERARCEWGSRGHLLAGERKHKIHGLQDLTVLFALGQAPEMRA